MAETTLIIVFLIFGALILLAILIAILWWLNTNTDDPNPNGNGGGGSTGSTGATGTNGTLCPCSAQASGPSDTPTGNPYNLTTSTTSSPITYNGGTAISYSNAIGWVVNNRTCTPIDMVTKFDQTEPNVIENELFQQLWEPSTLQPNQSFNWFTNTIEGTGGDVFSIVIYQGQHLQIFDEGENSNLISPDFTVSVDNFNTIVILDITADATNTNFVVTQSTCSPASDMIVPPNTVCTS